jgi:hypothetical protein
MSCLLSIMSGVGMEDWMYAASWDPQHVLQCELTQYGSYDRKKMQ